MEQDHMDEQGRVEIDERTFIREQDRLAREKKRRKNRKKRAVGGGIFSVVLVLGIWFFVWGRDLLFAEEEVSVKVLADASQSVVYARLDSVYGNEITYTVVNPVSEEDKSSDESNGGMPNRAGRENAEGMPEFGNMPQDAAGTQGSGNMPWEVGAEGTESMPGRGVSGGTTGVQAALVYDNVSYVLSTEMREDMIPVGTEVTTRLGTVSTFSRLRAGDYVALIMDQEGNEQIIAAVYVIG
jgi:hypothetical protein